MMMTKISGSSVVVILLLLVIKLVSSYPGPVPFPEGEGPDGTKYKTAYRCEGEEISISCGAEESIQVIRANYGRFSIAICNKHGYTDWSVNCMSPRTRKVIQNKCDGKTSCTMPVNSEVFGDPCPGTHKYVEVHFACRSRVSSTTRRPLPPWFIESGASDHLWVPSKPSPSSSTTRELTGSSVSSSSATLTSALMDIPTKSSVFSLRTPPNRKMMRRPILVTPPTTPLRIPITTPRQTTVSTTTSTTPTRTTTTTTMITTTSTITYTTTATMTLKRTKFSSTLSPFEKDLLELIEGDTEFCPLRFARNIEWGPTAKGEIAILPCPGGATGLARWACLEAENSEKAVWSGLGPDLSDCKSVLMSNLEVRVREEDPENVIASSLAHLTSSRNFYGGDLESAVDIMSTVANRIRYLLQVQSDSFYDKESYIQEVFQNIVRSAGNILSEKHRPAWRDLHHKSRQMEIASTLLVSLEENALLLAQVTNTPEFLEEISSNIMMAVSVLDVNLGVREDSVSFPPQPRTILNNVLENWSTTAVGGGGQEMQQQRRRRRPQLENSIHLPNSALVQNSNKRGLSKAVFFAYKDLHLLLRDAEQNLFQRREKEKKLILNSRIISATLGSSKAGRHTQIPPPGVSITLVHLEPNMSDPVCVYWDYELNGWSDNGCSVDLASSNESVTVCSCDHLTNFGLLMRPEGKRRQDGDDGAYFISEIIPGAAILTLEIAIYVAVCLSLIFVIIIVFKYRIKIHKLLLKYHCFHDEKKAGLEGCPKSQSFFTGVNLMVQTNPDEHVKPDQATRQISQYVMNPAPASLSELEYSHVILNPYTTMMMTEDKSILDGLSATKHLRDVVYMSPQLAQLTNTLKAKKKNCNGEHPGPCLHHTLQRQKAALPTAPNTFVNDDTMLPETEVVFRAVSPHGHVYWEIDPKRKDKTSSNDDSSSESSSSKHQSSDMSRQSSSRYSDSHPLIATTPPPPPAPNGNVLVNPFADMAMTSPVMLLDNSNQQQQQHSLTSSPSSRSDVRFSSLRGGAAHKFLPQQQQQQQQQQYRGSGRTKHHGSEDIQEDLQRQVQIRDLRSIPVSVKSNDYILAKIQTHMGRFSPHNDDNSELKTSPKQRKV